MKISKTVDDKCRELWALLATAVAKRAVDKVVTWGDVEGAEHYAHAAEKWLAKAGAREARYTYTRPRVPS